MRQQGRKSAQSRSLKAITLTERPSPPADFNALLTNIWNSVVNSKPADWFDGDSIPLLVNYCRSVHTLEVVGKETVKLDEILPQMLEMADPKIAKLLSQYKQLLALRNAEAKTAISLATALRLTQHSRQDAKTAFTADNNSFDDASAPWNLVAS